MKRILPILRIASVARTAAAFGAALLVLLATAEARSIDWGGSFGATNLQSDGTAVTATFTFELGTFGVFVPDETNTDMWAANWKVFDQATYVAAQSFFTSSVDADMHVNPLKVESSFNPGGDFDIGEQAYIWVYNQQGIDETTEWALFTDNDGLNGDDWLLPDPGDQTGQNLEWRVSTATTPPVFGGLDDVTGPGDRTATPPSFDIQTHTIPEPSAALLVVGALGLLGARRRRVRTSAAQSIR